MKRLYKDDKVDVEYREWCFDGSMAPDDWKVQYDDCEIPIEEIDYLTINSFLNDNQEFIDFIIKYRDEIYAPTRNITLEKIAEEEAEEERLKKSIPKVGMTAEQVRKSRWGNPNKINKDTYSWGVTEQWVYKQGYVYLENGIVTSVSESY